MSKMIPTFDASGSQKLINIPGSSPNGGLNLPSPVQPGWNEHNAVIASGQMEGTPQESVGAPVGTIPGKEMNYPAKSAPATLEVAGRDGAPEREGN
jgi:hypothetical protein